MSPTNPLQGINQKIAVGVLWNLGNLFLSRGASVIFTILLARFLTPEAFGLIAMITICFEVGRVVTDSGLGQAIIQSKKITNQDLNTVFFSNLTFSLIAYALLYILAPLISSFYGQSELTLLVRISGVVIVINSLKVVQIAILSREMNFKSQMTANTIGVGTSGTLAVAIAYYGGGVWSLVFQMLSFAMISTLILWISSTWRPKLLFSILSFRRLYNYGIYLLFEGLTRVIFDNTYLMVIGRTFSVEVTGLYFFSRKINNLISQNFTNAIMSSTFPALSTIQDSNNLLQLKYRQIINLSIFMFSPLMLFIAIVADPLVNTYFDEKWHDSAVYIQLFCFVGILYPLHALNINLLKVKGRSDMVLKIGFVKKAINLILLFIAIPYGVKCIILGQLVGSILGLIPNTYFTAKYISYNIKNQLVDVTKPIIAAIIASIAAFQIGVVFDMNSLLEILLKGLIVFNLYLLLSYLFKCEGFILLYEKYWLKLKKTLLPLNK